MSTKLNLLLVNCAWGSWMSWSACSVTCGTGTKIRIRMVSTHEENGGTACSGDSSETSQLDCGTCPAGIFLPMQLISTYL